MIKYTIYALCEPDSNAIRYIGQTRKKVKRRFIDHISEARLGSRSYKSKWVNKIMKLGEKPNLIIIDEIFVENVTKKNQEFIDLWEHFYIKKYSKLVNLTNDMSIKGVRMRSEREKELKRIKMLNKNWGNKVKLRKIDTGEMFEFPSVREATKILGWHPERLRLLVRGWVMVKQCGKPYKKTVKTYKGYEVVKDSL